MQQATLQRIVDFRRELHQYPERSFQQFETHKRIKNILLQLGVKEDWIRQISKEDQQPTGMTVDLYGTGEAKGQPFCVAFRADIDALTMLELNDGLPYVSKNQGLAHMCGHDGHTACLVGFVPLFLKEAHTIPSNKRVRLLFQPSEEGPLSGAELMIKKGCLQEVNQVYGFHNWPTGKFGELWCKDGAVMSQISVIKITILGDGGHGSAPENLKVAIWEAISFYTGIQQYIKQLQSQNRNFACTFPVFHSGQRFNVIHEKATLQGTLRTFDVETRDLVLNRVKSVLKDIQAKGFKVDLKIDISCLTSNTKKQSDNVLRVAKQFLGEDKVSSGTLPFRASEDFGFFTEVRPGAYFFFCTKKQEGEAFLHNGRFNFKDQLIEIASVFWLKLAQDRLAN